MSKYQECLNILKVPKFGNERQIEAIKYLEDLEKAREVIIQCRHARCPICWGTGSRGKELCFYCDGDGTSSCRCYAGLDGETVRDARAAIACCKRQHSKQGKQ